MTSPYEVEILPSNLMCGWCKGFGILTDSMCAEYECVVCKGAGMIKREVEEDEKT